MTQEQQAYLQGFAEKCAEYGVNPELMAKEAGFGNLLSGLFQGAGTLANNMTGNLLDRGATYVGNLWESGSHDEAAKAVSDYTNEQNNPAAPPSYNTPNSNIDPRAATASAAFRARNQPNSQWPQPYTGQNPFNSQGEYQYYTPQNSSGYAPQHTPRNGQGQSAYASSNYQPPGYFYNRIW